MRTDRTLTSHGFRGKAHQPGLPFGAFPGYGFTGCCMVRQPILKGWVIDGSRGRLMDDSSCAPDLVHGRPPGDHGLFSLSRT